MSEAEEYAKAIKETARFGQIGLETANKAGRFLALVFGEPLSEFSGMITDHLKFARWKRLAAMSDEVEKILASRGVSITRAVPPKLAIPILDSVSLEDDSSLTGLWETLLANAMDPSFNGELRYGFVDMIRSITGVEALLIWEMYRSLEHDGKLDPPSKLNETRFPREGLVEFIDIDDDSACVAINNLARLNLVSPGYFTAPAMKLGNLPMATYLGIAQISLTPLGARFVEACIKGSTLQAGDSVTERGTS